jgi:hypothetical protein
MEKREHKFSTHSSYEMFVMPLSFSLLREELGLYSGECNIKGD